MFRSHRRPYVLRIIARTSIVVPLLFLLVGCAQYAAPGRAADMKLFAARPEDQTDAAIERSLAKRPLATLPTAIAVVRVQQPGYRSETAEGWGNGRFSIVTTRDIEKPEHFSRLAALPMVRGIAPLNRTLLPSQLSGDYDLRQAAAAMHAEMLLIYTMDTAFHVEDKAAPLSVITLGLSPNKVAYVVSTASAVLLDTRNGYVYGVSEATQKRNQLANGWTSGSALDDARRGAETEAFEKLVGEMETMWRGVVANNAPASTQPAAADAQTP